MGITNLGAVGISAGGAYNPETVYKKYKVVSANGGSYMYINPTPAAGVPVTETSHWQQIAQKGDTGPSAYQAAVSAGYTGTEAEFNTAMSDLPTATEAANEAAATIDERESRMFVNLMGKSDRMADTAYGVKFTLNDGVYSVVNFAGHNYDGLMVRPKIGTQCVFVACDARLSQDGPGIGMKCVAYTLSGPDTVINNFLMVGANGPTNVVYSEWRRIFAVAPINKGVHSARGNVNLRFMADKAGGVDYQIKNIMVCDMADSITLDDVLSFAGDDSFYWEYIPDNAFAANVKSYVDRKSNELKSLIEVDIAAAKEEAVLDAIISPYRPMAVSPETKSIVSPAWYQGTTISGIEDGEKYIFAMKVSGEAYDDFTNVAEIRNSVFYHNSRVRYLKRTNATNRVGVYVGVILGETEASINVYGMAGNQSRIETSVISFNFYKITDAEYESEANIGLLAERIRDGKTISDYTYAHSWYEDENFISSHWKGKNALCIGDSLTAAGVWQSKLASVLGMNVSTHAMGGIGLAAMVDGYGAEHPALTSSDVSSKDLIIVYGGYNDRTKLKGAPSDMYPAQNTVAGLTNYVISKIFDLLVDAGNQGCQVLVITPHCHGKYSYADADGYDEYPTGSGQTLMDLADIMCEVANRNNVRYLNLWRESGINRWNWSIYASSPTPTNEDGSGAGPYPYNNDQLHLNTATGYPYLGEVIARYVATF